MSESAEVGSRDDSEEASQRPTECTADVSCTQTGPDDAITNQDSVGAEDSNRRRSKSGKRRSGFSRGRVSLTQLSRDGSAADHDLAGSALYKQIPMELPPAQRLSLLSRLQLRYTLEVLDTEFADVPGFDNLRAEAVESVGATIDQMENDGSFEQACTTSSLAANPVNIQMASTISSLTSCIKRLKQEETDWEGLISTLQAQAQAAEQQLSELDMENSDIPDEVKELSLSFLPQPQDTPHLTDTCTHIVRDVKTIALLMDDYCKSVELLNIVHRSAGRHMDSITRTLDEANHCQRCDPKESIQQLLAS